MLASLESHKCLASFLAFVVCVDIGTPKIVDGSSDLNHFLQLK